MTYRFSTLINKENGWYVARCPELSVTSQGKDVESARASLSEQSSFTSKHAALQKNDPRESFCTTVEVSG
jgi:predicted RNase H-like HicB family nuclease